MTAVSSPSASPHTGAKENDLILPETLQSEHFQLCKVGKPNAPDSPCTRAGSHRSARDAKPKSIKTRGFPSFHLWHVKSVSLTFAAVSIQTGELSATHHVHTGTLYD